LQKAKTAAIGNRVFIFISILVNEGIERTWAGHTNILHADVRLFEFPATVVPALADVR
jgi:hypothetical protein